MTNSSLPNLDYPLFTVPKLPEANQPSTHPPRILLLYGSVRERSYSRWAVSGRAWPGWPGHQAHSAL